ncbi:MAG: ABC-F family ATP-binding cassette domain-containing protein [Clostridia bacterium]|nr:ABC-F family ATP-binding cassette domain-containing protein [Clostridia bacterium]
MSIVSAHKLTKEFADRVLFKDAYFAIEKGDRVGFIGANGVGKTTLFKMIIGSEPSSAGEIITASGISVGYLEQHVCRDSSRTAYEETLTVFNELMLIEQELERINAELLTAHSNELIEKQIYFQEQFQSKGGLTYKNRTAAVLTGLGFSAEEIRLPVSALSGGQRSKIGLAKLLLCNNDLILLDEPTNHLDIESITWLEEFLKSFNGAAIIISHDRFFLDQVTDHTMEIESGKIFMTAGNFSRYEQLKEERNAALKKDYENKVKEIKRIEGIVEQQRRWNREKNIKTAESKLKQIERIEKTLEKPESENHKITIDFPVALQSGNNVLTVENERCSFGDTVLYENVNFDIKRGQRVCLIGPNGIGKSTLIKRLVDGRNAQTFRFGVGVTLGYFDQFQDSINPRLTPFDEIHNSYPGLTDTAVRNALAAFEYKGDDVFKQNRALSGGERARVSICRLVLSGKNFLVLDEPTNHLDIYSRKALEEALEGYKGTLLIISHDRYFINRIADKIIALRPDGADVIEGNYDDYLLFLEKNAAVTTKELEIDKPQKGKEAYLNNKKHQSELRKLQTAIKKAEEEISRLEAENEALKKDIDEAQSDYQRLEELTALLEKNDSDLEEQFELWENLCVKLSQLEEQNL